MTAENGIIKRFYPGVLLSFLIGCIAMAIAGQFEISVMLVAIVSGLALSSQTTSDTLKPGLEWSAKTILYLGVALLGLRIDLSLLLGSGFFLPALAIGLVAFTLTAGFFVSKWLTKDSHFALLIASAVAVCGVSAAAAVCCALPNCDKRNSQLALTIGGITVLSTFAMIAYPFVAQTLAMTDAESGMFLGGTIHNVSQAVGAGYIP